MTQCFEDRVTGIELGEPEPPSTPSGGVALAGELAHEFNNVLTTILGYAEMLAESFPREHAGQNFAEQILEAGRRAEQIVSQVLIISRRRTPMSWPLDVQETLSEILPSLYTSVSPLTRLDIDLSDVPMLMLGTSHELEHMLVSLCRNASEAQEGSGSVQLRIAPHRQLEGRRLKSGVLLPGSYVHISVSDEGPGIAPEHERRIFEPFFTTGRKHGRTGLGLSVVRSTAYALNGQIDVWNKTTGGACFNLYFPLAMAI